MAQVQEEIPSEKIATPTGSTTSPTQQRRQLGDRLDRRIDLKTQFLGYLGGAALNPERSQSGGHRPHAIPVVRGDKAELRVGHIQPLGGKPVNTIAGLEDFYLFDADDFIKHITDARALGSGLKHFRLPIGKDSELESLLLERLEARLDIRESCEPQISVHQLLFLVGRKIELLVLARPDEAVFGETPEVTMPPHQTAHEAVLKLLHAPDLRDLVAFALEQL